MESIEDLLTEFGDIVSDIDVDSISTDKDDYRHIKVILRFIDGSSLRISEFATPGKNPIRYSYYWLDSCSNLIIGWDNAPHHRSISTFPHHQHVRQQNNVSPSEKRNLKDVLHEIRSRIGGEVDGC